jgi:NADH dehydrogenase
MSQTHVVTGAFGYSGRYLAARLLDAGIAVRTLTSRRSGDPRIEAFPFDFEHPDRLVEHLRGAEVLYNTYWVRFSRGDITHETAVRNTKILFDAAHEAGVRRIVHVSITNPSADSPLPYFQGKAELERYLAQLDVSHAIVRPTVLFGREDILVNNIAYLLRGLPLFGIPAGRYRVQPVYVDDLAALLADLGSSDDDVVVDAVGPEIYEYREMVQLVREAIGARARLVTVPGWLVLAAGRILGGMVGDVVITADEIRGLTADLLVSCDPPTCPTSFRAWVEEHRGQLGVRYASELARHYPR